jgi:hypothetical protein
MTVPIKNLAPADAKFLTQLANAPSNLVIGVYEPGMVVAGNPVDQAQANQAFVQTVLDALATLQSIPKGQQILQGVQQNIKLNVDPATIHIKKTAATVNGKPDSSISIMIGLAVSPTTPITIKFNAQSGFAGLGKELWHAQMLIGGTVIYNMDQKMEFDLQGVPIKEQLTAEAEAITNGCGLLGGPAEAPIQGEFAPP